MFEQEYNCYPSSFLGREDLDKGNKIILPSSALETLARLNISYPMLFELVNERDNRRTHCGVLEFVAEEGTCYFPYWLMQHLLLGEGDIVKVSNTSLPKGTFVKLQPVSKDFLEVHNPRALLENSLRHFATLTVGDNIVINYNKKKFEIEIIETKPANAISIIEADVEVDFAPPKDYVEPVRPAPKMEESATEEKTEEATTIFSGAGHRLDGKAIKSTPPVRGQHPLLKEKKNIDQPWKDKIPGGVKREPPYGYLHLLEDKRKRI